MNILFLSTWFPYPPNNGSRIRVYHLLDALASQHTVSLFSFVFGTAKRDHTPPHRFREIVTLETDPHARHLIISSVRFLSPTPIVCLPLTRAMQMIQDMNNRCSYDAVIASTKGMAAYALNAKRIPFRVLEEHNSSSRQMYERYLNQGDLIQRMRCWVSWQKAKSYESRIIPRFDLCTMVSEQDKIATRRAIGDGGGRIEVVPNGVDCTYFDLRQNHTSLQPELVYTGSVTYAPNYDAVLFFATSILPRIRSVIPHTTLNVTGSTGTVKLDKLVAINGIHLTGYVDDIREILAGSQVCVVPIRSGGGTRLKILEAMAVGIPVVSTRKGAEGLEVVNGEHILIADEPEQFAHHVIRLLRQPTMGRELAHNARRLVEDKYNWGVIGKQFASIVEERFEQGQLQSRP